MIQIVVFSKDRPLQLHAHLQSMLYHLVHGRPEITVISPNDPHPDLPKWYHHWKNETERGFDETLHTICLGFHADDYVLFTCDDFLFLREWSPTPAATLLRGSPEVLAVAFWLGLNMHRSPLVWQSGAAELHDGFVTWQYDHPSLTGQAKLPGCGHWSYRFSIPATLYRASDVHRLVNTMRTKAPWRYPGDLEIRGNSKHIEFARNRLAMPLVSVCAAFQVNMVHRHQPMTMALDESFSPERLASEYASGKRLNWRKLAGLVPEDAAFPTKLWELTDEK